MDVIICEDQPEQLEDITSTIEKYAMMEDSDIHVALSTSNPEEVLAYAKQHKADCYFLDVDLKHELTGIKLGSEIRKMDPLCQIIFITTHSEMAYLTFIHKIAAMDFIIKDEADVLREKILSSLQEAHRRNRQMAKHPKTGRLQLTVSGRTRHIDYETIYCIEASPNPHKVILHLANEQIECSGKLKHFESLYTDFYRCHKSCIVNKSLIQEIDKETRMITLTNGLTCLASSRLLKGLL